MKPIRYPDFDLHIQSTVSGFRSQMLNSPAGQASSSCGPIFSDLELENYLLELGRPRRLEDYFLGTYYFNRDLYHLPMAGLTHLNGADNSFSAYRFHEEDPIYFRNRLRLVCRCGEEENGKVYGPEHPAVTTYTTYTWMYEW